jgi:hypothetical protein
MGKKGGKKWGKIGKKEEKNGEKLEKTDPNPLLAWPKFCPPSRSTPSLWTF